MRRQMVVDAAQQYEERERLREESERVLRCTSDEVIGSLEQ